MASGRTILVTGCSEGSAGHALALEFASQGFRVFATARSTKSLAALEKMDIETFALDVTSWESISALRREIAARTGGKLDILFNNAGIMYEGPAVEADRVEVGAMFDTNVFGLFNMIQQFTPLLLASAATTSAPPIIINTASVVARIPLLFTAQYNASKAAVASYSDTLRIELAPLGVKVITLYMGIVATNINATGKSRFGSNSIYIDAEPGLHERSRRHLVDGMRTDEFAKGVVRAVLGKQNSLTQGEAIWYGAKANIVWLLSVVGWRKVFDSTVEEAVNLTKDVKLSIADRGLATIL